MPLGCTVRIRPNRITIIKPGIMRSSPKLFEERYVYERGFATVYAGRLQPKLSDLQEGVQVSLRRMRRLLSATFFFITGAATIAFLVGEPYWTAPLIVAGLVALVSYRTIPLKEIGRDARERVINAVFTFVGEDSFRREDENAFPVDRFVEAGLVQGRPEMENCLGGVHNGVRFQAVEATYNDRVRAAYDRLERSPRRQVDGLLISIEMEWPHRGRVLVTRQNPMYVGRTILETETPDILITGVRSDTEDADFDRQFQVFSEDPFQASAVVTPGFRRNLAALANPLGSDEFNVAVFEGNVLFAVQIDARLLDWPDPARSLGQAAEKARHVLRHLMWIRLIVDRITGGYLDIDELIFEETGGVGEHRYRGYKIVRDGAGSFAVRRDDGGVVPGARPFVKAKDAIAFIDLVAPR